MKHTTNNSNPSNQRESRSGLTLVELLIALAILTLVTAFVVPRLRIINKERNIREVARVVGSAISSARDRAIQDGAAGIVIERNLNFVSNTNLGRVYYAGTRLYQMRQLRQAYEGDRANDFVFVAWVINDAGDRSFRAFIPLPIEQEPPGLNLEDAPPSFRSGDVLLLNDTPFTIRNVLDPVPSLFTGGASINNNPIPDFLVPLELQFLDTDGRPTTGGDWVDFNTNRSMNQVLTDFDGSGDAIPFTNANANGPFATPSVAQILYGGFEIQRFRKVESSVVNLPDGHLIDLRYSGPSDELPCPASPNDLSGFDCDFDTLTVFGLSLAGSIDETAPANREIQIFFDGKGAIDKLAFNGESRLSGQSIDLFIHEYSPTTPTAPLPAAQTLLSNPSNLWVNVGFNGGINIGYNAPPALGTDIGVMISAARSLSKNRTSSSQ